jgi:hypothetical protein
MSRFDEARHGVYTIQPTPRQLNGVGDWLVELQIARHTVGDHRVQLFNSPERCPTRDEAVAACISVGRDILDGKVPDRAVLF